MIVFRKQYFILATLLFGIEILIALFVHDNFIRPYVGDFLVVILIYCFIRSFFTFSIIKTAWLVLLFACAIEVLQYINLVKRLGLQHSRFATIVLGNSFAWMDIAAYVLGIAAVLLLEKKDILHSNSLHTT